MDIAGYKTLQLDSIRTRLVHLDIFRESWTKSSEITDKFIKPLRVTEHNRMLSGEQ